MQEQFFIKIQDTLSVERLGVYGKHDDPDECVLLARYLWNMSICESLYSPPDAMCPIDLNDFCKSFK